jgi:hypothetical protein
MVALDRAAGGPLPIAIAKLRWKVKLINLDIQWRAFLALLVLSRSSLANCMIMFISRKH